jgi:hypothetical protein
MVTIDDYLRIRHWDDRRYDVFLSYNYADREFAKRFARYFKASGLRVWFDAWEVQPGMAIASKMAQAIENCKCQLVLIGKEGAARGARLDFAYIDACTGHPAVIPVLLPGADLRHVPRSLKSKLPFDLSKWGNEADAVAELTRLLRRTLPTLGDRKGEYSDAAFPRIFLCHAKEDAERAEDLYFGLRHRMLDPWYDKEALLVGDLWEDKIMLAIEASDFFAILLSSVSVDKTGYVNREVRKAISEYHLRPYGISYLLPIRLDVCEIPAIKLDANTTLKDLQWINVFRGDQNAVSELAEQVWAQWERRT